MTTYEIKGSANYCAECIEAPAWEDMIQFPTLQNLRGIPWAGYTILVPRDYAGARLVVFPAESQLSETVAHDLNLHAKAELNADTTLSGYLACNRRIKAIRLRGVPSNALALPAEYFGSPAVGEVFDTVDGVPVSRKYVVPQKASNGTSGKRVERLWRRVDDKFLPMHYDTGQFWRESDKFNWNDHVVVTQKLHGSSCRLGHIPVKRKLTWRDKIARWFGIPVNEFDYDYVGGSRRVIKDPSLQQDHFYGEGNDIWTEAALKYGPLLPKGVILYGELVGYVGGTSKPIQAGYTYNVAEGDTELFVYRVALVQEDGGLYDLSWPGVKEFCKERGLKWVPELWEGEVFALIPNFWVNNNFHENYCSGTFVEDPIPLCKESPCDEGVVVRRDGVIPFAAKIKSPDFYEFETKQLDKAE